MKLTAYVDGSYNSNNHTYGGGVVILVPGHENPLKHKVSGNDTNFARLRNVAGEILGAIEAVKLAKAVKCTHLIIHYDYEGLEKWTLPLSHPNHWKAKKTLTQAYKSIIEDARTCMKIEFVKEAAHTGVLYNEMADALAKEACRQ